LIRQQHKTTAPHFSGKRNAGLFAWNQQFREAETAGLEIRVEQVRISCKKKWR
jgi:hypothetical protein